MLPKASSIRRSRPFFFSFFFFFLHLALNLNLPSPKKNVHQQGEDILGFLDVRDVAHSLLDSLPADVVSDAKLLRRMKALEDAGPVFAAKVVSELPAGYGGDGSFLPASRADRMTLLELIHDAFLFPKAPPAKAEAEEAKGDRKPSGVSHRVGVRRRSFENLVFPYFLSLAPPRPRALSGMKGGWEGHLSVRFRKRMRSGETRLAPPRSPLPPASPDEKTTPKKNGKNEKQLFDASGTSFTAIVSQSDVARFLLSRRDGLGKLGKSTVAEVGWASRGAVVSVTPEASSVAALALMRRRNIAGVAVVDARTGKLIGNFSATELRSLTSEHLGALALPVAEMLALEHGLEFWGIDHSAPEAAPALEHSSKFARAAHRRRSQLGGDVGQEIAACSAGDTVEAVLEKLVGRRLHRLYVVDEEAKPVGVRKLERAGVFFSCPFFFGVFFFFFRGKRRKTRNSVSLFHLFSLPPFFAQKTGRHSD